MFTELEQLVSRWLLQDGRFLCQPAPREFVLPSRVIVQTEPLVKKVRVALVIRMDLALATDTRGPLLQLLDQGPTVGSSTLHVADLVKTSPYHGGFKQPGRRNVR
jgi:hypothetical protein